MSALLVGYARGSTDQQDRTAQRDDLLGLGVEAEQIYVDHGLTGTNRERPGLREALAACRAGDTLVVTKLDRLARSLPDARAIADELTARQISLSLGGSVYDPPDAVGRLLFNVLAMVAEFEYDLIRLRTREDLRRLVQRLWPASPVTGSPLLFGWRYAHRPRGSGNGCPARITPRPGDEALCGRGVGRRSQLGGEHPRAAHLLGGNRVDHSVGELDRLEGDLYVHVDDAPEIPGMHEQVERREAQSFPDRAPPHGGLDDPGKVDAAHRLPCRTDERRPPRAWVSLHSGTGRIRRLPGRIVVLQQLGTEAHSRADVTEHVDRSPSRARRRPVPVRGSQPDDSIGEEVQPVEEDHVGSPNHDHQALHSQAQGASADRVGSPPAPGDRSSALSRGGHRGTRELRMAFVTLTGSPPERGFRPETNSAYSAVSTPTRAIRPAPSAWMPQP